MNPKLIGLAARRRVTIDPPTVAIGFENYVDAMVPMLGEHQSLSAFATAPDVLHQVFGLPVGYVNQRRPKFL